MRDDNAARDLGVFQQRAKALHRVLGICGECGATLTPDHDCSIAAELESSIYKAACARAERVAGHACSTCDGYGIRLEFGASITGELCAACKGSGERPR